MMVMPKIRDFNAKTDDPLSTDLGQLKRAHRWQLRVGE
jgi:hypothetical protein